jgi:hypothetical protein
LAVVRSVGIAGIGVMMSSKMKMMIWIRTVMPCIRAMIGMTMKFAASTMITRIAEHVGLTWER